MKNKIAVVGLGYVGLPLALLAKSKGYQTIGIDLDTKKLQKIDRGESPITDEFVEKLLKPKYLTVVSDFTIISEVKVIIVCVPTPVKHDFMPDYGPLRRAVESIAKHLAKDSLVVIESTINPGVSDEIVIPLLEKISGLKEGKDFYTAHCPERINPGDPKWSVRNIPRVIGSNSKPGLDIAVKFYQNLLDAQIMPMNSIKEAEAVKIVENTFRDVNIAFVNELAMSFSKLDINVMNVINGAATKPFAFLPHYPGIGVGGHCIPVDPYYLIEYAKEQGFSHDFLIHAREINNKMPEFSVQMLVDALNDVGIATKGANIAVLGISYKANVGDDRESPYYKVEKILMERKVSFESYDPYLLQKSNKNSMPEVLHKKDAVLLVTDHEEFKNFDFSTIPNIKVLVDGRNCLKSQNVRGIKYYGIGAHAAEK